MIQLLSLMSFGGGILNSQHLTKVSLCFSCIGTVNIRILVNVLSATKNVSKAFFGFKVVALLLQGTTTFVFELKLLDDSQRKPSKVHLISTSP